MKHTKPISLMQPVHVPARAAVIGDLLSKLSCFLVAFRGGNPHLCKESEGLKSPYD